MTNSRHIGLLDMVGPFPDAVVSCTKKKAGPSHTVSPDMNLGWRAACIKNFTCLLWHQHTLEKKIQKDKGSPDRNIYDLFFSLLISSFRVSLSSTVPTTICGYLNLNVLNYIKLKIQGFIPWAIPAVKDPQEASACQHGLKSLWTAKSNLGRWLCSLSLPASTAEGSKSSSAIALQTRALGICWYHSHQWHNQDSRLFATAHRSQNSTLVFISKDCIDGRTNLVEMPQSGELLK